MVASRVDEFETTCPNCRKDFDVLSTDTEAQCPHCHVTVQLTEPEPAAAPYVPPAPRAPAPAAVVDDRGARDAAAEKAARAKAAAQEREAARAKAAEEAARRDAERAAQAEADRARKAQAAKAAAEAKAKRDLERQAAAEARRAEQATLAKAKAEAKARAAAERAQQKAIAADAKAKMEAERKAAKAAAKAGATPPAKGFARLNFLTRRERTAPDAREAVKVIDLEGVGPTFAAKLEKAGIRTSDDLLAADAGELAKKTRINKTEIRKWQDMADLVHVNGIGPQFAEVLVRCDINSVAELARQEPKPLAAKVQALVDSKKVTIVGTGVSEKRAKAWIAEARKLAPPPADPGALALAKVRGEDRAPQNPLLTETGLVEASAFRGKAFRVECKRCEEAFLVADNVRRGTCPYCSADQALQPVSLVPAEPPKVDDRELADEARHEAQRGFLSRFSRREVADLPAKPAAAEARAPARKPLFNLRGDPEARAARDAERKAAAEAKAKARQAVAEQAAKDKAAAAKAKAERDAEAAKAKQAAAAAKAEADARRKAEAEQAKAAKLAEKAKAKEAKPAEPAPAPAKGKAKPAPAPVAAEADEATSRRFTIFGNKALESVDCAHCGHKFTVKATQRKATCPSCHSRLALVPDDGTPLPATAASAAPQVAAAKAAPVTVSDKGKAKAPAKAPKAAPLPAPDIPVVATAAVPGSGDDKKATKLAAKEAKAKAKAEAKAAKRAEKDAAKAEKLKAKQAAAKAKADAKAAKLAEKAAAKGEPAPALAAKPGKASKGDAPADAKLQGKKAKQAEADVAASAAPLDDKKAAKLAAKEAKAKAKAEAKAAKLAAKEAAKAEKLKAKEASAKAKAEAKAAKLAAKGKNAEGDAYSAPVAGQAVPVIDLEGVGPKHAKTLEGKGIKTSDDLLAADPEALSKSTKIDLTSIRKWQDMADLVHVDGIGPQFAEVLVRSGVNSVAELARQQPKPLAQAIQALVDSKKVTIVGVTVTKKRTKQWIKSARKHKPRAGAAAAPADVSDKKAAKLAAKEAKAKAKAEAKAAKLAAKEAKKAEKLAAKGKTVEADGKAVDQKVAKLAKDETLKGKADAAVADEPLSPRQLAKLEKQKAKDEERRKRVLAQREADKARLEGLENAGLWAQAVATPLTAARTDGAWAASVEERRAKAAEAPSKAERKEALGGKVRLIDGRSLFARLPEDKRERKPPRLPDGQSPFVHLDEDERKATPTPRLPDGRSVFERLPEDESADYDRLRVFGHKPGQEYTTKGGFHITEEVVKTEAPATVELGTARDRRALKRQAKADDKTRREQEKLARKEAKEARKQRLKEEREAAVARRVAKVEAAGDQPAGKPLLGFLKKDKEPDETVEVKPAKSADVDAPRVRQLTKVQPASEQGKTPRFGVFGRRKDVPEEPETLPAEARLETEPKRKLLREKSAAARTENEAKDDVAQLGFFERRKQAADEKRKAKELAAQAKADAAAQKQAEKLAKKAAKDGKPAEAPAADPKPRFGFLRKGGRPKDAQKDAKDARKGAGADELTKGKPAKQVKAEKADEKRKPLLGFLGKDPDAAKAKDAEKEARLRAKPKAAQAEPDEGRSGFLSVFSRQPKEEAAAEPAKGKGKGKATAADEGAGKPRLDFAARRRAFLEAQAAKREERAKANEAKAQLKAEEKARRQAEKDAAAAEKAKAKALDDKAAAKQAAAEAKRKATEEKAAAKQKAADEKLKALEAERAAEAKAEAARRKAEEKARFAAERAAERAAKAQAKADAKAAKLAAKETAQPIPLAEAAAGPDAKQTARAAREAEKARARELKELAKRQKAAEKAAARQAARDEARSSRTGLERGDGEPAPAAVAAPAPTPRPEPALPTPPSTVQVTPRGRARQGPPAGETTTRRIPVQRTVTKTVRKPLVYDRAAIDAALRSHGQTPPR